MAVGVLFVTITENPEVFPAAQERGIGKNIVRRDRGLGKQFTERVNVLTAVQGKDNRHGGGNDIGEDGNDLGLSPSPHLIQMPGELHGESRLSAIRCPPYCDDLTHWCPPAKWFPTSGTQGNPPAPSGTAPRLSYPLGIQERNARSLWYSGRQAALPDRERQAV